jgi:hypothetical protein
LITEGGSLSTVRGFAKYLGRYVRHPTIANSRITSFDRINVGFFYEEYKENEKIRYDVTMEVNEFISALLQRIPEPSVS